MHKNNAQCVSWTCLANDRPSVSYKYSHDTPHRQCQPQSGQTPRLSWLQFIHFLCWYGNYKWGMGREEAAPLCEMFGIYIIVHAVSSQNKATNSESSHASICRRLWFHDCICTAHNHTQWPMTYTHTLWSTTWGYFRNIWRIFSKNDSTVRMSPSNKNGAPFKLLGNPLQ